MEENYQRLRSILMALRNGDLRAINDIENTKAIAITAYNLAQSNPYSMNDNDKEALKNLVMICNILYNRTDRSVLPVEDGVYDMLMEAYKKIDPNFQIGSYIADFEPMTDKSVNVESNENKIRNPLIFYPDEPKDEVRQQFERDLISFDINRFCYDEFFNPYYQFAGGQAYSERVRNTKHNHPTLVGTLDKAKYVTIADAMEKLQNGAIPDNVSILEKDFFGDHIHKGIITAFEQLELVLELKYDGISVEADCTDHIISARTRGDTGAEQAVDITPILKGYPFPKNKALKNRVVGVKFEAIMKNSDLEAFNRERNYHYANGRTAIIGLFKDTEAYKYQKYITLVPLALDRGNVPEVQNRIEEIELLNRVYSSHGEQLRYTTIKGDLQTNLFLIKKFAEEAKYARNYLDFMFDGVVISYLDENIRAQLGRDHYINKFSIALKFDPDEKQATFLGYTFEVGATGKICPMIHYTPVEFKGTVHTKSSGASLKRFLDLNLKPGDVINVTYTNDVMPYVNKLDCEANRINPNPPVPFIDKCPICGTPLEVSESNKTATCPNPNCLGRKSARMVNTLYSLGIRGFAEAAVKSMKVYSLHELLCLDHNYVVKCIGPGNAENLADAIIMAEQKPTEDFRLMGALGFTNMGPQKWKLIFTRFTMQELVSTLESNPDRVYQTIMNIPGLYTSAAEVVVNEYPIYKDDIMVFMTKFRVIDSKNMVMKKQIRFTGCRDSQLVEQLSKEGYDISGESSATKKTDILLVPYQGFVSGKTKKVSPNCLIIPIDEFKQNLQRYL